MNHLNPLHPLPPYWASIWFVFVPKRPGKCVRSASGPLRVKAGTGSRHEARRRS
ncbi:hypothetical protein E2C01_094425 [Portunus trituberculatus]|uniref:Uncharacterized protein n=1 Tax=Portunus trituberculatus TaxID=210409 RepID=A0A5B7JM34_PORTR|nr:hypothetical protein [Portunus trituberculatus]